jgi:hypothetical protein
LECARTHDREAVISWNDATIKDFHWQTWTPNDVFIAAVLFARIMYTVTLCNEYVRATAGNEDADIKTYQAEARFLRALAITTRSICLVIRLLLPKLIKPGAFFPKQTTRAELFNYIESELQAIEPDLGAPKFEYGRADQGAAAMLLGEVIFER